MIFLTEVILIVSLGLYSYDSQAERCMDYASTPGYNIVKYRLKNAHK